MVGTKVKVGGRYSPHSPLSLGGERTSLVVRGCRDNYLITVLVGGTCGGGSDLTLFFSLLLNLSNLLTLL